MEIGTTIRGIRKSRGITQLELAMRIGLSKNAVSLIEKNETFPHKATIDRICTALNTSSSVLFLLSCDDYGIPKHKVDQFNALKKLMIQLIKE